MFTVGMRVQLVETGELGTIVSIASAKQLLTVRTVGGEVLRVTADAVRKLDELEYTFLLDALGLQPQPAQGPLQMGAQQ